ncbi:OmpA family protein [Variovorax guangxiensis]|uniref:Outer membrane protein OmpA-like peptidoglycan-associated protein n=1 Tax=Variovorax guangxiensis TaxID=1775474 RepID=A0A840FWN6_9BURK|nr:OmpA family protein [Variovorax guangxiensis]MBB4225172.1 outer membrane protein OmpA-like peptidoglycan-associated protein [Variovorax guangxiensis]
MQTKNTPKNQPPRLLALGAAGIAAIVLAGCGSLHDERYYWCQGQSCAPAPVATPAPAPVPAPPVPVTQRVTLSADALFAFDRSSATDMLPKGRSELDALARALQSRELQVQSLTITGHTDRLGSEAYNEQLALRRANTVRDYLKGAGIGVPMEVRSMGEREPVTRDCVGTQRTSLLIACLQPDRRVVVDITGQAYKKN